MTFYLPIILMVVATTVYHIAQKSVPTQVNPVFSLTMNYISALLGTILLIPLYPARTAGSWSAKSINWASCAVGLSIVGVELAVLLAYRAGWKISLVSVIGNTASALLLVGVGLALFHEHVSARSLLGVALCLAGLALVTQP
jgi:drug/metabolite transporter (DMT)-like permease